MLIKIRYYYLLTKGRREQRALGQSEHSQNRPGKLTACTAGGHVFHTKKTVRTTFKVSVLDKK